MVHFGQRGSAVTMLASRIAALKRRVSNTSNPPAPAPPSVVPAPQVPLQPAPPSAKRQRPSGSCASSDEPPGSQTSHTNFMMDRMLNRSVSGPALLPSSTWWSRIMSDSIAPRWDAQMPLLGRPFRISEPCCGLGSATLAAQCLGLPLSLDGSASDLKPAARDFVLANCPSICHVFANATQHGDGRGFCYRHGTMCEVAGRDDFLAVGTPCQPFSDYSVQHMRNGCASHDLLDITLGQQHN